MSKKLIPGKDRIKRYLAYSLGEILLVVIGILIAVQINNCNESNKSRKNEHYILTEILSNLQQDGDQVQSILRQRKITQASIIRMAGYLNTPDEIVADTFSYDLAQMLTFERYFPIRTSYEVAKVSGLKVSNKQLRSSIANYYEYEQHSVQTSLKDIESTFLNQFPAISTDHYFIEDYGTFVRLTDYKNPDFIESIQEILSFFIPNHSGTLRKLQEFEDVNATIQEKVAVELEEF
ncbi:DUF6090 family protein [Neolewinella persica]|uniref:DUF6090 family protein n=1 Tax=Neolewinella persica TaxID=70998 RepID=UPI00036C1BDA|nr:DUF6090 family protein [Neolewinella persica]